MVHTSTRMLEERHLRAHAHASVFCLAPTGSGFGARLKLVTMSGCIPVIIDDLVRVSIICGCCPAAVCWSGFNSMAHGA